MAEPKSGRSLTIPKRADAVVQIPVEACNFTSG
jgi:hypothetical protein